MAEDVSIAGRKTFFIAPDRSLVSDSCLERLMSHGYEAYSISDDGLCPIKKKVDDIIRLFPGSIIYFNVDASIAGIEWKSYLKELCAGLRHEAKVGIIIKARDSAEERYRIETEYRNDVRVRAGILALSGSREEDYAQIQEVLAQSGAIGRRKIIRAEADMNSSVLFPEGAARLKDISRAYFCCIFEEMVFANIFDRFNGLVVNFNGMSFKSDAVLVMKHSRAGENCGIFMFVKEDGSPELETEQKELLNKKIYNILTAGRRQEIEAAFVSR